MIVKAWGVLEYTPLMLSQAMQRMNVSHSILSCSGPVCQYREVFGTFDHQECWPVIVHSISDIDRVVDRVNHDRIVVFVFDAKSKIQNSNLPTWSPGLDVQSEISKRLNPKSQKPFVLEMKELSAMEYIGIASKTSILSELQSTWCRVNPYSLRKKVQEAVVRYLCNDLSRAALQRTLRLTHHGTALLQLLKGPALPLKDAVALAKTTGSEEAAKKFDIDPFDINFLLSSWEKYK